MRYVDGYLVPVSKRKVKAYLALARKAGRIWREYGALEYRECVGDDIDIKGPVVSFPRQLRLRRGETVVFAWIVFRSRADRDRINAKVMKDPRIANFDPSKMPVDGKRMVFGGFRVLVDLAD